MSEDRRRGELALQAQNEQLEAEVRARTAALQLVLDSVGDGLLVCDRGGILGKVRSRAVAEWFGPVEPGRPVWEYLAPDDEAQRAALRLGFEQLGEDLLPFELNAAQMPARLQRGGSEFQLRYRQVVEDRAFVCVVVVIRDITAELSRQQAEQASRELAVMMAQVARDPEPFLAFVEEAGRLLGNLAAERPFEAKLRDLHTLKGNAAIYGFEGFAARCHALEDQAAADPGEALGPAPIAELASAWRRALRPLGALLKVQPDPSLRISPEEHRDFLRRLERGEDHATLLRLARSWQRDRLRHLLAPCQAQAARIAGELGKEVEVDIADRGLRLPDPAFRPVISALIHCLRNAIDHGIEPPELRRARGKPPAGRIRLCAREEGGEFRLSIEDDGAGVPWERVREQAEAHSLPATTQEDLVQALLQDGFSTRREVTALSGRGVGLSAVHQLCRELGGRTSLHSIPGRGTQLQLVLPIPR